MSSHAKGRGATTGFVRAALAAMCVIGCGTALGGDTDGDGMSDEYEVFFGVNYANPAGPALSETNAADAAENYDGDWLVNSNECAVLADPFAPDTDRDGFADHADGNVSSRAWLDWGEAFWLDPLDGNELDVTFAQPAWLLGAGKTGGVWQGEAPTAWSADGDAPGGGPALLWLLVDRALLTNDAVLALSARDSPDGALCVDLRDALDATIASNLFGNLLPNAGTNDVAIKRHVPLDSYGEAAGIALRRVAGTVTIYNTALYVDKDGDGLDADQEAQLGTSDAYADSDGDGLSDWAEVFVYGTDPLDPDSDHDGMRDGTEAYYGADPAVSNFYQCLPFEELFESNTVSVGYLDGQNDWEVAPPNGALVCADPVFEGQQAMALSHTDATVRVRHLFAAPTSSVVWLDMRVMALDAALSNEVDVAAGMAFSNGRLHAYDGYAAASNRWTALTNHPPVTQGQWVRLTAGLDYGAREWLVCLNGAKAAEGLGFARPLPEFSSLILLGRAGNFDNVRVTLEMPDDISLDGDSLPDAWEVEYFGNLGQTDTGDADGDGLNNGAEYAAGTAPTDADTDSDGADDAQETQWGWPAAESNLYSTLPWTCGFETSEGYVAGDVDGQLNWAVRNGQGSVQSSNVFAGDNALEIAAGGAAWAGAAQLFAAPTNRVVWTQLRLLPSACELFEEIPLRSAALYAVNPAGWWCGRDGGNWRTSAVAAAAGQWAQVAVREDYAAHTWDLYVGADAVFRGVAFADPSVDACGRFAALSGRSGVQRADAIQVGFAAPGHVDVDADGLINSVEQALGTNPEDADSDNDGMGDGQEAAWGFDPTVSNGFFRIDAQSGTNTWATGFEPAEGYATGALNGQNGWRASNGVEVVDYVSHNGAQSVVAPSRGATNGPTRDLVGIIGAEGRSRVWVSFYCRMPQGIPMGVDSNVAAAVCLAGGRLHAFDGTLGEWRFSDRVFQIGTNDWMRLDLMADYDAKRYLACANGVLALENVAFVNPAVTRLSALKMKGSPSEGVGDSFFDDVRLSTEEPAGELDFDDDGLSNAGEYGLGTHAKNPDTDGDGLPDGWEAANGSDPLADDADADPDGDRLENAREYETGTAADDADSDDDGLGDGYEADESATDPLSADSDADGLADGWEVRYGLNPAVADDPDADPDNDGLVNGQEHALGTNPFDTDSDGDGMADAWEGAHTNLNAASGQNASLVSWWRFDEPSGGTAYDDSEMWLNDGRLSGGASRAAAGRAGRALALAGGDQLVRVPEHYSLDSTAGLTLALWVRFAALPAGEPVVLASKQDEAGRVEYALSYAASSNLLCFSHANASGQSESVSVVCALTVGMWTHLAVSVDGSAVTFHANAAPCGAAQTLAFSRSNLGDLLIGPGMQGLVDDARVYNAPLGSAQLAGLVEAQADADGDGLSNLVESLYGLDLQADDAALDADSDGLSNAAEILTHGTDPFNADSDGDGASDGYEVNTLATNPLVADQGGAGGPAVTVLYPEEGALILW